MHMTTDRGHGYGGKSPTAKKGVPNKIEKTLHEFKEGRLHSGSKKGPEVTNRKQAIAIAFSQQRKANKGEL